MRVLLGVTGSIAAFKALNLARLLQEEAELKIVITRGGLNFVTPLSFSTLLNCEVYTDEDYWKPRDEILHISLSRWADIVVIAPATANFIGKWAHGITDDLLSSTVIAFNGPVIVAPAMHSEMWHSPIVQENIQKVEEIGGIRVGPETGKLASGDIGIGRMSPPEKIKNVILEYRDLISSLSGRKILIVYGRTEENIDPVRVITNRSSGKMGAYLVRWAKLLGASVVSIVGKVETPIPHSDKLTRVVSTEEMQSEVLENIQDVDVLIMVAAPADFKPKETSAEKIKKGSKINIELEPTPDILKSVKKFKKGKVFVGFALESSELLSNAKGKLQEKGLDLIVANPPEAMGSDRVSGYLVTAESSRPFNNLSKAQLAREIMLWVAEKLERLGN